MFFQFVYLGKIIQNSIMKRILLSFLVLISSLTIYAQTLTFSSDTTTAIGTADLIEIVAYGFVYNNNSTDSIEVAWERVVENVPTGWDGTAICDKINCWFQSVSASPQTFYIPANGNSRFDVHFYPAFIPGNGTVHLKVWAVGDSANTAVTGVYKATAEEPVSADFASENDKIRIYPNPARDHILIRNLPANQFSTIEIYNIFGRRMLSFSQPSGRDSIVQKFDIGSLPKGIYMVRVFDSAANVIFTKSLSKE